MISDNFNNPIFQEKDLYDLMYKGHIDILDQIFVEDSQEIKKLLEAASISPKQPPHYDSLAQFDQANQKNWFIPEDYYPNLVEYLYGCCTTKEQADRVSEELEAFIEHGMFDLLFCLKYIVDTLRQNNIVWGVGRGSSVASYVLYLIGVHKIDSIKYNLDWREFLR
jgi:DNA polymerase III alpha subunit